MCLLCKIIVTRRSCVQADFWIRDDTSARRHVFFYRRCMCSGTAGTGLVFAITHAVIYAAIVRALRPQPTQAN